MPRDKRHIDYNLVDKISETIKPNKDASAASMKFFELFSEKIGPHHMIPCRVCHTFLRSQVLFVDSDLKHEAIILCPRHYLQFKSYYAAALPDDTRPIIMHNLAEYVHCEDVVRSLIRDDGYPFSCERPVYSEAAYPLVADMSRCDFFLDFMRRDAMLKKIRKGRAKGEHRSDIERIGEESARIYGLDKLPFPTPWEQITWWEPK